MVEAAQASEGEDRQLMGYPYYKRFPRDFFEGTIGMPFEVKAAYGLLLDLIFIRDGKLPDDARFIAGHLGLSVRKWNLIRQKLLTWPNPDGSVGKIKADRGIISNSRADNLTIERRSSRDNHEINKGEANENNNFQKPRAGVRARASEPEPEYDGDDDRRGAVDDWPAGKSLDHAKALCEHVGHAGKLDTARSPGLIQSLGRLHVWKRDGASWEHDVIPTVTALAEKAKGPISTWAYFDRAVAESIAANRAALTIPEHTDVQRSRPEPAADAHRSRQLGAMAFLAEGQDQ